MTDIYPDKDWYWIIDESYPLMRILLRCFLFLAWPNWSVLVQCNLFLLFCVTAHSNLLWLLHCCSNLICWFWVLCYWLPICAISEFGIYPCIYYCVAFVIYLGKLGSFFLFFLASSHDPLDPNVCDIIRYCDYW